MRSSIGNQLLLSLSIFLLGAANLASATVISASSNGYGINATLNALGLNLNAGPLPTGANGTAPAPYNLSQTALNVNVTGSIPIVVSGNIGADAVNGAATSNVDGLSGSRLSVASGGVIGASINAKTLPILGSGITLLGLDATLSSTAQISGDFGSLVATGLTTIENLTLTLNAINVPLSAFVGVNVAPNTSVNLAVLGIANASLILNEQTIAGGNSAITVNAFHLTTNILNVVTSDVILGHSQVQVSASPVPEPASVALLGLGLLPAARIVQSVRRRQRISTIQPVSLADSL